MALSIAWGLLLACAYAVEHAELLRLPASLLSLSRPPGGGEGASVFLHHSAALISAGSIALACYGFGRLAGRAVMPAAGVGALVTEVLYFALGTGIGTLLIFAAAHANLLYRATATALVALGVAALGVSLVRDGAYLLPLLKREIDGLRGDHLAWLPLAALALLILCAFLLALAPPTARDALMYHLSVPKAYIAANALLDLPENVMSYYPFGAEMLFMWAMLVGPDTGANLIHTVFWLVCLALVYGCAVGLTPRPAWGSLAALTFASVPTGVFTAAIAHNEMMVCLYVVLAFVLIGRWYAAGDPGALMWAGICYGLALGVKHLVIVMAPVFGLVVLLRAARADRERWLRTLWLGAGALLLAVAVASPWYIQNALRTGNPLYPFFWDLFPTHSVAWDRQRASVFETFLRTNWGQHGDPLATLAIPWNLSIRAADGVNELFDGIAGPAFLLLLPVTAILFRSLPRRWKVVTALAAVYAIAWVSQSQQVRFLLPALCAASVAGMASLARVGATDRRFAAPQRTMVLSLALVLLLNCLVVMARVAEENPVHVVVGSEARDAYLSRQLRYYPFYLAINQRLPAGGRVFLIDMRNDTYYLEKPAFSDSVLEDYTVAQIVSAARAPGDIHAELRRRGLTHILVREDIFLDPTLTPLDADGEARWRAFLLSYTRLLLSDGAIALYAVSQ